MASTLVTAVEVRTPDAAHLTVWEMPVRLARGDELPSGAQYADLTALVFYTSSELTTVTVLMTESDRQGLIRLLGGRKK